MRSERKFHRRRRRRCRRHLNKKCWACGTGEGLTHFPTVVDCGNCVNSKFLLKAEGGAPLLPSFPPRNRKRRRRRKKCWTLFSWDDGSDRHPLISSAASLNQHSKIKKKEEEEEKKKRLQVSTCSPFLVVDFVPRQAPTCHNFPSSSSPDPPPILPHARSDAGVSWRLQKLRKRITKKSPSRPLPRRLRRVPCQYYERTTKLDLLRQRRPSPVWWTPGVVLFE